MSEIQYFVFRVDDSEDNSGFIRDELKKGILRQGWGAEGMNIDQDKKGFLDAWNKAWENDSVPKEKRIRKYNNLRIMREINPNDYIIIPKTSLEHDYSGRFFTIVKCEEKYSFSLANGKNDFGHFIKVAPLFSCPYDFDDNSLIISAKFRAYQSALNRVYNQEFCEAVNKLLDIKNTRDTFFGESNGSYLKTIYDSTLNERKSYLEAIVKTIRHWSPRKLEDVIQQLFERNGYELIGKNKYDKKGGDIDLIFSDKKSLMNTIYDLTSKTSNIHIQAKNKIGNDSNDIEGVNQLAKMEAKEDKHNIMILISLVDDFNEETKKSANDNNVILINGVNFASLLVRYGIDIADI